ncbi:hypothetical protein PMIN04_000021 [Paraphaeosphaeria minitans]
MFAALRNCRGMNGSFHSMALIFACICELLDLVGDFTSSVVYWHISFSKFGCFACICLAMLCSFGAGWVPLVPLSYTLNGSHVSSIMPISNSTCYAHHNCTGSLFQKFDVFGFLRIWKCGFFCILHLPSSSA